MAARTGFTIPNATRFLETQNFRPSEPDQVDFFTLGNQRYGVVTGAVPVLSSNNILISGPSILVCNGDPVYVSSSSVSMPLLAGSAQDRFDNVVWDNTDTRFKLVEGVPSLDPVLPDLTDTQILIATMFTPAGASGANPLNLVDKRVLLPKSYVSSVDDTSILLANMRTTADIPFSIMGNGVMQWGDVTLARSTTRTLTTSGSLNVLGGLTGSNATFGGSVTAAKLTSGNLRQGSGNPSELTGLVGDLYQDNGGTGGLWFKQSQGWARVVTDLGAGTSDASTIPPGTIITSLLAAGDAALQGWLPLDGGVYSASSCGRLWALKNSHPFSDWAEGLTNALRLPDMTNRIPMQKESSVAIGSTGGSMSRVITEPNMPRHSHFGPNAGAGVTGPGGGHSHTASVDTAGAHGHTVSGGAHSHPISDPGHYHMYPPFIGKFVLQTWNGPWTTPDYSASSTTPGSRSGPGDGTAAALSNVSIPTSADHSHDIVGGGSHTHNVSITNSATHTHAMPAESYVGSGQPLDTTPAYMVIRYFIKT